ncbi:MULTISPECIES: sensor histidine kinase [unclassified Tolypothrix]|uniref:sensor histidine kinase n=1 Tax=unclassified Tolypothrix TaxID=2649714 RepID=UPI0005EAAA4D|nr:MULTISPECIES: HAMP domain-containing sensor histidine kinase [unclassified Tolypothrix]BAY89224.1 two-component sensor histidine kinase [Microchaete diplosiphon NIES-3275]EKE97850.1 sensor histidine kinase [Tolypothrix sp. PCC 7601]MBE9082226.1 HAMP domain-containing histidine kinase [Tolypothrix sp. LEGE 11397]UYD23517.1 HAMP domain-containing histidine kinase [Tolypothrix sp. PCC 7712]UYD34255.1 HAMP domain-containing histidine kinase [Tolypothrix sp. PCC 7601]
MDFSQVLAEKTESILQKWVLEVRKDQHIESADDLSYTAIKNHLPDVIKAMVTVLSKSQGNDVKSIVVASWQHGVLRAEQGFDPGEIAREYHLLRRVIFETIETNLLQGTPTAIVRAMRLIDTVIDEAIARCFNSYFEERLRELQQLYNSLMLHNEELNRLVNANQDYLAQLAHELKSPLASIIGYSDLFLRQQRQQTRVNNNNVNVEHIERVLRNGRHLLRLINDILEISRYDAGKVQPEPELINVSEIINNVLEMLEPLAREQKLPIVVNCQSAPQQIFTDPVKLQQVITNLISNAIRYTESGSIDISCQILDDQKWAIAVKDTGIGIAPENQTQIFDPYFRVGCQKSYVPGSTGLGLAIVARLVKLLQGEINLVSEVGVGSTFSLTFPLQLKM